MTEQELYETKWYEYRPMKPEVATKVFMLAWAKRMTEYNAVLGHGKYVNVLKGFKSFDVPYLIGNKNWKMLNNLRKWADEHGMKYDQFWLFATKAHLDLKFQKNYINVYFNEKILARVKELSEKHDKDHITFSTAKHMKPEAYRGYDFQIDYYDYIVAKVEVRHNKNTVPMVLNALVESNKMSPVYLTMETKYSEGAF